MTFDEDTRKEEADLDELTQQINSLKEACVENSKKRSKERRRSREAYEKAHAQNGSNGSHTSSKKKKKRSKTLNEKKQKQPQSNQQPQPQSVDPVLAMQNRRERIEKMKIMLIRAIAFWMIFSLLAILILVGSTVVLSLKVHNLEKQVSSGKIVSEIPDEKDTESESEISQTDVKSEPTEEPEESEKTLVTGIDESDNLAEAGDQRKVYLTFDSGPDSNTAAILDALKSNNIKATFFVTGDDSGDMDEIYRRIVAEGHTLGMHSFSNQYSSLYSSKEAFLNDFNKLSEYLFKTTGLRSKYYRFPGGSGNEVSNVDMSEFVRVLNEKDVTYFDWNVAAMDVATDYTVEDVVTSVTEGVKKYKTSVVLFHEGEDKKVTADAIGPLVKALKEINAEILPIDENTRVIQYLKADSVS